MRIGGHYRLDYPRGCSFLPPLQIKQKATIKDDHKRIIGVFSFKDIGCPLLDAPKKLIEQEIQMSTAEEKNTQLPPLARKGINDIIDQTAQDALIRICQANNVTYAAIFGSVARGTAKEASDLDILVKFRSRKSLIDLIRIEGEISEALGRKTDLVTENSLSPYIRSAIQSELVVLYAEG